MSNLNYIINNDPLAERESQKRKEIEEDMTEIELNSNEQDDEENEWENKRMQKLNKTHLGYSYDEDEDGFPTSESMDDDDFEEEMRWDRSYMHSHMMFPRFPHHKRFQDHKMGGRDPRFMRNMGREGVERLIMQLRQNGHSDEDIKKKFFKNQKMMQKRKMHYDFYGNEGGLKMQNKMRKIDMEERRKEMRKELIGSFFGDKGENHIEYSQEQKEKLDEEIKSLLVQRDRFIDLLKSSVRSGSSVEEIENLDNIAKDNLEKVFNLVKLIEDTDFKKTKMALLLELKCELNCISTIEQNKIN